MGSLKIQLPSSKSISNRLLIIRHLSEHKFGIENLSISDDTRTLESALGSIDLGNNQSEINVGDAGTAYRFITALCSVYPQVTIVDGSDRLRERPIKGLVNALRSIGAEIQYLQEENFAPVQIEGSNLRTGKVELEASETSQFLSALLLIAPVIGGMSIELLGEMPSKSYSILTLSLMKEFGVSIEVNGSKLIVPDKSYSVYDKLTYTVENDWSAASYWYSMVALGLIEEVVLDGLFQNSVQPDAYLEKLFNDFGINTRFDGNRVIITKIEAGVVNDSYDLENNPDLVQTLVVLCALLKKDITIHGVRTLPFKETDRVLALQQELVKLNVNLEIVSDNTVRINSNALKIPNEITINTYGDHRMAMAFSPLLFYAKVTFTDPDVVTKSYPNFWQELNKVGINW